MTTDAARLRAVAIVGPTAAGKSALALRVAESLGVPILCCDSVSVYRGLDIGSAKPGAEDRRRVPHRMLDLVDPDQEFSAGRYAELARAELARGPAVICGGTGLYLRSTGWTHSGERESSEADGGAARASFEATWEAREAADPGAVHRELARRDLETASEVHPNNVVRSLRALWLCELHGEPISAVRRRNPPAQLVELLMIVLDPGVTPVDAAIERRCEAMLAAGWLAEVEALRAAGYAADCKAMRSLGYRELLEHLAGERTLEQARAAIVRATRKYARRQRTFFRHQFRDLLPEARAIAIEHPDACPFDRIAAFVADAPA